MEEAEFILRVHNAFPDDGCPREWLPSSCQCDECLELKEFLESNPSWKAWGAKECRWSYTTSLMGDSFMYFLPAYMIAMFTDCEEADVAVDASVYQFLHRNERSGTPYLFSKFNKDQRELILFWLNEFLVRFDGDKKAHTCYEFLVDWHSYQ